VARKLIVEVVGDSTSYQRALNKSATATNQFGQAMGQASPKVGKLSTGLAAAGTSSLFLGGAAVGLAVALGSKTVSAASDLNEQISRTQVVMGASADEMIAWSKTTASSIGIAQRAALTAAATFAGLFQSVGVGQQKAGGFSRVLVKLAADLASLQNATPEEALIALRSGLAGEAEPLRRFNIFLSEARVQQEALAETGKKTTSSLTQQEKTVARYNLILKDGAVANDNFKDTSSGLANQQRTLAAETDDLSTTIGQGLVPTMQIATGVLIAFVGSTNDAIGAVSGLREAAKDTKFFDGFNKGVEDATTKTDGWLKKIRDGIPGMQEFLDLRNKIIDATTGEPPALTPKERTFTPGAVSPARERAAGRVAPQTAANTRAGQAVIDRITQQSAAQAAAQKDYNLALANSIKRAAHLRTLIRADPDNVKLQKRLSTELGKQATLREQIAAAAKSQAASDRSAAQTAKENRQQAARDAAERRRTRAENRQAATKRKQFQALGLTAEGLQPTPGSGALLRRALSLKGTPLDVGKNHRELNKIVTFLRKNFKKAGRDVRQAILDMLNAISGAADTANKKTGPLTKTAGLNTKKIVEGLGLSPDEERALRGRLSHFNTAGRRLAGSGSRTTGGGGFVDDRPIVVNTTVNIDGQKVATSTTKHQQKMRRRNPQQKRGPHRIGGT
jgi:hypothetical protein